MPTLIRKEFIFQQGLKTQAPAQQNVKYMLNFKVTLKSQVDLKHMLNCFAESKQVQIFIWI